MDAVIETIRAAITPDASAEARAAGAAACRTILAALGTEPGQPLVSDAQAPAPPTPQVAALASAIKNVPPDQLADLLIAKLRTLVPPDQQPAVRRIHIPLVAPNVKVTP